METSIVVPGLDRCFFSNFNLQYDPASSSWKSPPGVEIRAKGYGSWLSVLDYTIFKKKVPMYQDLYTNLTTYGYVDGKDTFVAQYDFRLDPFHIMTNGTYFADTTTLVEKASSLNGGAKVFLAGHSYGCSIAHMFLQFAPQAWKDQYIAGYVSFSGPYLGSPLAPFVALTGISSGGAHSSGIQMNQTLVSNWALNTGVISALFPFPQWVNSGEPIIGFGGKNYTSLELPDAFATVGGAASGRAAAAMSPNYDILPPNVTTHCFNGYGSQTLFQTFFPDNVTDPLGISPSSATMLDGDTVVPRSSLNECQSWKGHQAYEVTSREIQGLIHGVGPFTEFYWWMDLMNPASEKST
jgi:pimeloyl-ACP methyl ester carboxylesterase